jgi:hypothetical protein
MIDVYSHLGFLNPMDGSMSKANVTRDETGTSYEQWRIC